MGLVFSPSQTVKDARCFVDFSIPRCYTGGSPLFLQDSFNDLSRFNNDGIAYDTVFDKNIILIKKGTSASYILIPKTSTLNESPLSGRTSSIWFYLSSTKSPQVIYKEGNDKSGIICYVDNNFLKCEIYSNYNYYVGIEKKFFITKNRWYNLVLNYFSEPPYFEAYINLALDNRNIVTESFKDQTTLFYNGDVLEYEGEPLFLTDFDFITDSLIFGSLSGKSYINQQPVSGVGEKYKLDGGIGAFFTISNRVLSESEIARNYDSLKGKYGYTDVEAEIVKDGLLCYLDSSNENSYNGGKLWNDISYNESDCNFINGITLVQENNGILRTDGIDEYGLINTNAVRVPNKTPYTKMMWLKYNNVNNTGSEEVNILRDILTPGSSLNINTETKTLCGVQDIGRVEGGEIYCINSNIVNPNLENFFTTPTKIIPENFDEVYSGRSNTLGVNRSFLFKKGKDVYGVGQDYGQFGLYNINRNYNTIANMPGSWDKVLGYTGYSSFLSGGNNIFVAGRSFVNGLSSNSPAYVPLSSFGYRFTDLSSKVLNTLALSAGAGGKKLFAAGYRMFNGNYYINAETSSVLLDFGNALVAFEGILNRNGTRNGKPYYGFYNSVENFAELGWSSSTNQWIFSADNSIVRTEIITFGNNTITRYPWEVAEIGNTWSLTDWEGPKPLSALNYDSLGLNGALSSVPAGFSLVSPLSNFTDIEAGYFQSFALSGTKLFGAGPKSLIGLGPDIGIPNTTFTLITGDWDKVVAGYNSSYALSANTQKWFSTGNNLYGQLGLGDRVDRNTFTEIPGKFDKIIPTGSTVFALSSRSLIYCGLQPGRTDKNHIIQSSTTFKPYNFNLYNNIIDDPYYDKVTLLLHMDGVEGDRSFIDSSKYNNKLKVFGNPVISRNVKKIGEGSVYFNGNESYFLIEPSSNFGAFGLDDFTIEYWEYIVNFSGQYFPSIHYGRTGDWGIGFGSIWGVRYEENGTFIRFGAMGTAYDFINLSTNTNEWRHIALVRHNGTLTLYINGVAHPTTFDLSSINLPQGSFDSIIGGARFGGGDGVFYSTNGYIDELRVTKGVARYTANFTPSTSPFSPQELNYNNLISGISNLSGANYPAPGIALIKNHKQFLYPFKTKVETKIDTLSSWNLITYSYDDYGYSKLYVIGNDTTQTIESPLYYSAFASDSNQLQLGYPGLGLDIGAALLYNRQLTYEEIVQNYHATKSRFDL